VYILTFGANGCILHALCGELVLGPACCSSHLIASLWLHDRFEIMSGILYLNVVEEDLLLLLSSVV